MLIKVTNQCAMACSHCMEDSRPRTGQHMEWDVFLAALRCADRMEEMARAIDYRSILLTGGECTEHPRFLDMVDETIRRGLRPVVLTNGLWLRDDPRLRSELLDRRDVLVQLTNDTRVYPRKVEDPRHPNVTFVPELSALLPVGRGASLHREDIRPLRAPGSYNFRSLTRAYSDVRHAVYHLRLRTVLGKSGHCTPSITHEGVVVAGESRLCGRIGTVESTIEELTLGVLRMGSCNNCGLEDVLEPAHRKAIGLEEK